MSLSIFGKSPTLDVLLGSQYPFELLNGTFVGHKFFTACSWVRIPDGTLLQTTSEVE